MYFHTIIVFVSAADEGNRRIHAFTAKYSPVNVERFAHNLNGAPCISYNFTCLKGPAGTKKDVYSAETVGGKLACPDKIFSELEGKIYAALEKWRNATLAKNRNSKVFIASNDELRYLAVFQPRLKEHLMLIKGFATERVEKRGGEMLAIVNAFLAPMKEEEIRKAPWPSDEIMNSVWPDGNWKRPALEEANKRYVRKSKGASNNSSNVSSDSNGSSGSSVSSDTSGSSGLSGSNGSNDTSGSSESHNFNESTESEDYAVPEDFTESEDSETSSGTQELFPEDEIPF